MSGEIAILRRCVRCQRYESIDNYSPNAKVCRPCMAWSNGRRLGNLGSRNRSIRITKLGKEDLERWRAEDREGAA
jgi:hypothetical protein